MSPARATAAALALVGGAGCAGASTSVVAPDAHYPVSLSRGVRDRDGSLVPAERRKVVGAFEATRTAWALAYKLVALTPKTDLSAAIDRQVRAAGGDAIINLRVGTLHCELNFVPVLPALPIWPGCARVYVRGDIIKVAPGAAAPAASAGPASGERRDAISASAATTPAPAEAASPARPPAPKGASVSSKGGWL